MSKANKDTDVIKHLIEAAIGNKESFYKYNKIYDWYECNKNVVYDNYSGCVLDIDDAEVMNCINCNINEKHIALDYDILNMLLLLQCMYYKLADNYDKKTFLQYCILQDHHKDMYGTMFDCDIESTLDIPFTINMKDNIAVSSARINSHAKVLNTILKMMHQFLLTGYFSESNGLIPFLIFHSDVLGNEKKWRERIRYWTICHMAYVEHCKQNIKKKDMIYNEVYMCGNTGDLPNSITKITAYIEEAERLIQSAMNGTFPYSKMPTV